MRQAWLDAMRVAGLFGHFLPDRPVAIAVGDESDVA